MTMSDFHQRLVDKYGADPAAEIEVPRGWRTLVETIFKTLCEGDIVAPSKVRKANEKFGQLRIHLVYDGPHAERFFQYIAAAEDLALRTCDRCGAPGSARSEWPLKTPKIICDACLSHARVLDQLDRRRTELVSAARDWCAKSAAAGHWLKPSEYAFHRWRKDGELKREAMRHAFRLVVHELDLLSVRYRPKQVADFEAYQQLVDKIDVDEIIKRVS